jgi:hypothetical protein
MSHAQNMPPVQTIGGPDLIPPPMMPQLIPDLSGQESTSNNFSAIGSESNAVPPDVYEVWCLKAIEDTKLKLQAPNLDANSQHSFNWLLRQLQGQLADHRALVQQNNAFVKSVQANPRTALTNIPDPIAYAFSRDVAHYERELAAPDLTTNERETDAAMLANFKFTLADNQTNAQLWADLHMAEQNKDAGKMVQSKQRLADYLAIKLGELQGKTYPAGMSYDAVMNEYQKQVGNGATGNK